MKPSIELFNLIKSLSKSEKRFFKLTSSLQSGEKNYLKLFDYIEKQSFYDEKQLKSDFENEIFIKHLPSEKNHLYKLILKSLRMFYSDQSIGSVLSQDIKNIEILYKKALYKECEKLVSRSKKTAEKYEKFYYWFELINWEKKLIESSYESGVFSINIDELVDEEEMVLSKLRNLAEYMVLYAKINLIFRSGGFTRSVEEETRVAEIADNHLIKGKNTAISSNAASICYYIKGLCAATTRNYIDSYVYFNKTKEILDNNPEVKLDSSKRYVLVQFHLLRCYIDSGNFEKAESLIDEIRLLKSQKGFKTIDISVQIFSNSYNQELVLLHKKGEFEKSVHLIPIIDKEEGLLKGDITKEMEIVLKCNKAYSCFGTRDFKTSLQYINDVLNDNESMLRQDIYSFSRLLNLIIHFELENYDFLEYVIRSTNRYLSKQDREYKIEMLCIKHIRKLSKTSIESSQVEIFEKMKEEVNELLDTHHERVILEYFDLISWIESKLQKKSFAEIVKIKHQTN